MSNKKDLTRIEDLGEYLHQLDDGPEESPSFESETSDFNSQEESTEEGESFSSDFDSGPSEFETDFSSSSEDFSSGEESFSYSEPESESETEDEIIPSFEASDDSLAPPLFEANEETPSDEAITDPIEENSFSEPVPQEVEESIPVETYSPPEPVAPPSRQPENFADVKAFAESTHFTGSSVEGNPSFSVLIKNVKYAEDVSDILTLLKEFNLVSDSEDQTRSRLMRGQLLIPRVSEYTAVFIAHKLRRFDLDLQVGLSDDIHPPKHSEAPELGVVSKQSLYQNQHHHFQFDDAKLDLSQIIVAATPTLEGYQVVRYLGVASEHQMLDGEVVEDEISDQVPKYYQELANKLKAHALKQKANAVVGLNYQLTPLPSEYGHAIQRYRLSCTGNLVWVRKI